MVINYMPLRKLALAGATVAICSSCAATGGDQIVSNPSIQLAEQAESANFANVILIDMASKSAVYGPIGGQPYDCSDARNKCISTPFGVISTPVKCSTKSLDSNDASTNTIGTIKYASSASRVVSAQILYRPEQRFLAWIYSTQGGILALISHPLKGDVVSQLISDGKAIGLQNAFDKQSVLRRITPEPFLQCSDNVIHP